MLALACHPLAARTHWALRPLAEAAYTWGYFRGRISKSTVGRWLSQAALKPHRVRRWLHSLDPDFRRKVRRIVRLYLHPPQSARVICVDEKTQVQILERLHPGRLLAPGRSDHTEVHYRRHGTVAVLAGLDVRSAQVVVKARRRRRHQEFLELLKALRARWPRGKLIIVLDNLSIHTTPEVQTWLRAQAGRVRFEFLPVHLAQPDRALVQHPGTPGAAARQRQLYQERATRIYRFARHWNSIARPFRWTFKGYPRCR